MPPEKRVQNKRSTKDRYIVIIESTGLLLKAYGFSRKGESD